MSYRKLIIPGFIMLVSLIFFIYSNALSLDDFCCSNNTCIVDETTIPQGTPSIEPTPSDTEGINPNTPQVKKGYNLHVNLDEKTMYVYKDGELLKTYPVSGGKPKTPSPLGTWRIITKDTWGEGFGGAWMGINVPWGKYGIHGTVEPWFVGKSNSSKGCIRMKNKDVNELFKIVPHGATVTIVHTNPVFRNMKSGDIGSDVKEVQGCLKALGYFKGSANGVFGTGLKASVIKFQKANKIRANGVIDKRTLDIILSKIGAIDSLL